MAIKPKYIYWAVLIGGALYFVTKVQKINRQHTDTVNALLDEPAAPSAAPVVVAPNAPPASAE